jgi:chromate reductase
VRILAISGSLRQGSYNTQLAREAVSLARELGCEAELFAGLEAVEPFNEDREGEHLPGVESLRRQIASADLVLVATPEYNHTIPGQLKNVIDWGSRPSVETGVLAAKPVVVISASTSAYGGQWAQEETRKALRAAGARVLEVETPIAMARANRMLSEGLSERMRDRLRTLLESAVAQIEGATVAS